MDTKAKRLETGRVAGRGLMSILAIAAAVTILGGGAQITVKLHRERQFLRKEIAQLRAEKERLSRVVAQTAPAIDNNRSSALSAPGPEPGTAPGATVIENRPFTNFIARILEGEDPPELTAEQAESYLQQTRRSAASLLAAFRGTRDAKFLEEALQKFPNDPQVNFAAAIKKDVAPEERRQRLDAFKQSAPDNALANYLSAIDYFKSGQTAQALEDLNAVSGKPQLDDYSMEFTQSAEEGYRAAGYSEPESKMIAMTSLLMPHLAQMRDLGRNMAELAGSYRQAGDQSSADQVLQMACTLGQRFDQAPRECLISQLVGMAIERTALSAMDPAGPYANGTVNDRLAEMTQQRAGMKQLTQQFDAVQPMMSEGDWSSYADRQRLFGEKKALEWLVAKFGHQ